MFYSFLATSVDGGSVWDMLSDNGQAETVTESLLMDIGLGPRISRHTRATVRRTRLTSQFPISLSLSLSLCLSMLMCLYLLH